MPIYGKTEIAYFQLTPWGIKRLQSGKLPERLSTTSRQVLQDLVEMDGAAEWDELKMRAGANPQALGVALRRLIDLGYVKPVTPEPEGG